MTLDFLAGLTGFALARLLLCGGAHLDWCAGTGPQGDLPLRTAILLAAGLGFLLGRVAGRFRLLRSLALLAAAAHAFALPSLARGFGRSFLSLEVDPATADPGRIAGLFLALVLAGIPAAAGGLLWGSLPAGRSARWAGLSALAGGAGVLLSPGGFQGGSAWADGLLLAGAALLLARKGLRERPLTATETPPGAFSPRLTGNRLAALALLIGAGAAAAGVLVTALARTALERDGGAGAGALGGGAILGAAGTGLLLASLLRWPPWRLLGSGLSLAGLAGLVTAGLVDALPGVYTAALERLGPSAAGDGAARLVMALLSVAGPALFGGAALGAAAASRGAALWVPLAGGAGVAGLLTAPALAEAVGVQGSLLLSAALLAAVGGLLILLEAGSLAGRGLWSLALLASCAVVLGDTRPWDVRRLAAAVTQRPSPVEGPGPSSRGRGEPGRVLVRLEGRLESASLKVLHGRSPALVAGGRARQVETPAARLADALAIHLPALLGPGGGETLLLAPPTGTAWEAIRAHGSFHVSVGAGDAAVVSTFLLAGRLRDLDDLPARPSRLRVIPSGPRRVLAFPGTDLDLILAPPLVRESDLHRILSARTLDLARSRLRRGGIVAASLSLRSLSREGLERAMRLFLRRFPGASAWRAGSELLLLGGDRPVHADLERLRLGSRAPSLLEALLELGLDDPLKILALHVAPLDRLVGAGGGEGSSSLVGPATAARLRPVYAENLRWLASYLGAKDPGLRLPAAFGQEARLAARRRVGVLRGVHRRNLLARAALRDGDPDTALRLAEEAHRMDPSDLEAPLLVAGALTRRASEALREERPADAEADYGRALAAHPESVAALTALSWLRYAEGDLAEAAVLMERATRSAPWAAELRRRLGLIRLEEGNLAGAEEALLAAHDLDPRGAGALYLLGEVARLRGRADRARDLYERALALGAERASVHAARARLEIDAGRPERALRFLEDGLREKPGDPEILFLKSRVSLGRGDSAGARRDLLAAVAAGGPRYRARAMLDPVLRSLLVGGAEPSREQAGDGTPEPPRPEAGVETRER